MKLLHRANVVLGGTLVILGFLLNRIAMRRLDNNPGSQRRFWERVFISSGLFVATGVFVAGAGSIVK